MSRWDKLEGYVRMQGIQDVMDFDRLNNDEAEFVRLNRLAQKIDTMAKADPTLMKFVAGTNLFSSLRTLAMAMQTRAAQQGKTKEEE